jgi:hypothetical protein
MWLFRSTATCARAAGITGSCKQLLQDLAGLARGLGPAKFSPPFSPTGGQTSDGDDKHQRKDRKRNDFHGR